MMLNPIAFRPGPVTFWTTLVYLALLIPVIVINEVVPPVAQRTPYEGVNLTEAWLDLTTLTSRYHPYNSRYNDEVRSWLLLRIEEILNQNGAQWATDDGESSANSSASVVIFNDLQSNITFLDNLFLHGSNLGKGSAGAKAVYFEGTNIYLYIRGLLDDSGPWWRTQNVGHSGRGGKGGTMVNAHYDSVSTGFGATDNGMGVVTVLQLIKYFSHPDRQPERGIICLLNNGEEDGLYGARVFDQSPLLPFVHTFLNLEGAGAGGRALLFRTSDQEVTAAYAKTADPFGSVIASDMFSLGVIKSATDYSVFKDVYGQRGLDLAFFKPRARYHTHEDDAKHTSRSSLWHMMSAALHTTINLSGDTGDTFDGPRPDGIRGKVSNGSPSDGVWFDLLGKGFVLFNLRGMFAWSLTILIAGPLILFLITYILLSLDRYYFFTVSVRTYDQPDYETVPIGGWKGFFRFPIALVFSVALLVGSGFLIRKVNPFIVYGSQYTVWVMMVSLFYFVFWVVMRSLNFARPSALHRGYVHIWLFILGWAILVAATVFEDRFHISAVYIFVFYESAVFLSTVITLLELFALPKKTDWGLRVRADHDNRDHYRELPPVDDLISPTPGEAVTPAPHEDPDEEHHDGSATEATPLLGGGSANGENTRTTFTTTYRRSISALVAGARKVQESGEKPFEHEQPWSGHLPSTLWWFQFLFLGPFLIILVAQAGLFLVDATRQTGADGSSLLTPFILISFFTVLLLVPLTPFIHRITHHVPIFLLVVFIATLVYNLSVFPFSSSNRYKAYWQQRLDLDTGATTIAVRGIEQYIRPMIAELPSASGQQIPCHDSSRPGLVECVYDGSAVAPNLNPDLPDGVPPQQGYSQLVTINATRGEGNTAVLEVDAINTKTCSLTFKTPVSRIQVEGSSWDDRFGPYPDIGVGFLQLWRRFPQKAWLVYFEWFNEDISDSSASANDKSGELDSGLGAGRGNELKSRTSGLDGTICCAWSDINEPGVIVAYEEAEKFVPTWGTWSKASEALVEGCKSFKL